MKAAQASKIVEPSISRRVWVVGDGEEAPVLLVGRLLELGHEVLVTHSDFPDPAEAFRAEEGFDESLEAFGPASILEFGGFPGNFTVRLLVKDHGTVERSVGAVVLAPGARKETSLGAWGLEPSSGILDLGELERRLEHGGDGGFGAEGAPATVVFLSGFHHESNPAAQERAMKAASRLRALGATRVLFLTEHFKVADQGMERLSGEARTHGVLFVKLTGTAPRLDQREERTKVTYYDETIEEEVSVSPDLIVLEEAYRPPRDAPVLAERLGVHLDARGFIQKENVRNYPIFTNRTGIFVIGSGKGPVSVSEGCEEAGAAALEVHELLDPVREMETKGRISLDRKKCTICLTCYRLCPHRAISFLERRPLFSELACRACGICESECPMGAIRLETYAISSDAEASPGVNSRGTELPDGHVRLVAFACENSAFQAGRLAKLQETALPAGLEMIRVPCAGKVAAEDVMEAFRSGADGVMVLGCFDGSCMSVEGSILARWRVEWIREAIEEIGLEGDRLLFANLSPVSGASLASLAGEMEARLSKRGRNPLGKPRSER